MKLQDDVTSQMMEIQRLKGRESSAPLQGATVNNELHIKGESRKNSEFLWFFSNRAADRAETGVDKKGESAERSQEKRH